MIAVYEMVRFAIEIYGYAFCRVTDFAQVMINS